jgi:hypothetical protein
MGAALQPRAKQLVGATIVLIVVASLTTLAQSQAGQRALKQLGIVDGPAAFTELGFDNPLELPTTVHRAPSPVLIPFTVTDHSSRSARYGWKVVIAGTPERVLRSGSVLLGARQAVTIVPRIELGCATRTRVNVALSSGEHIGFWAACAERARAPTTRRRPESRRTSADRKRSTRRTTRAH